MLRPTPPKPMAILTLVRQNKVVHQATAKQCIASLQTMSGETRDRIAVSLALLGRITDRRALRTP